MTTLLLSFTFRNKVYDGEFFIDQTPFPIFLFVVLKDKELIEEFGEDITIKTDGNHRLPKKDDYPELITLRQTLFDAIKKTGAFIQARGKRMVPREAQIRPGQSR